MKIPPPIDFRTLEERMKASQERVKQGPAPDDALMVGYHDETGEIVLKIDGNVFGMPATTAEWIAGCLLGTVQAARKATQI